jgi:putative ABC transport system permease protein
MIRNYLLTAWRNLARNKFYSALNITGLAVGLAVGIMILLWVQDELSYDRFHKKAERIFKINSHLGSGEGEQVWEGAPAPLSKMAQKVPDIENSVRIADYWSNPIYSYAGKKFTEPLKAYVDPSFFDIFDFKVIRGNRKKLFESSHTVVITESLARKFFGENDPIGKVLVEDGKENFTVTGVMRDIPQNSSLRYNMLFPMSLNAERFGGNGEWKTIDEDLGNYYYKIFLLLKPGADARVTAQKLSRIYETTRNNEPAGKAFSVQSLGSLHLFTADGKNSSMQRVNIFIIVAVFILIIACINYVNLSTARAITRSKEVSMRKIIGAARKQLFMQFIVESAMLFLISAGLSFAIIKLLLPLYNEVSGKTLSFQLNDANVWLLLAVAITGSLATASIYPALLLSSFKPIEALKGKLGKGMGNATFRRVLVVTQFVFSVVLIIATIVVALQLKYVREKDLGYNREHVFSFSLRQDVTQHNDAIRAELMKVQGVTNVSFSAGSVVGINTTTGDTYWEGKEPDHTFLIHPTGIDEHFIPLFDIQLSAGKNFGGTKSDSAKFILNETAIRDARIEDPIGKKFQLWDVTGTIIGVVKDFNYASLKERIEPMIFYYEPGNHVVSVKTSGRGANKAVEVAKSIWMRYSSEYPFSYSFIDEDYDNLYKAEQRTGTLFNIFSIIAIGISCLGLLGLATYTAEVKRREIGIRKVLGASIANITGMLSRSFLSLVVISLFVAIPISYLTMSFWLQDFAYRIQLSWWIFVVAAILAVLIAFVAVGVQAVRAAMANPIGSLKED